MQRDRETERERMRENENGSVCCPYPDEPLGMPSSHRTLGDLYSGEVCRWYKWPESGPRCWHVLRTQCPCPCFLKQQWLAAPGTLASVLGTCFVRWCCGIDAAPGQPQAALGQLNRAVGVGGRSAQGFGWVSLSWRRGQWLACCGCTEA
jgi:hypothetical protein